MALESKTTTAEEEEEEPAELKAITRRFRVSLVLTVPVVLLAMGHVVGLSLERLGSPALRHWLELTGVKRPGSVWAGMM